MSCAVRGCRRWGWYATCLAGGVGAGALLYTCRTATPDPPVPSLSAEAFNALQDQQLLAHALKPGHLPWPPTSSRARSATARTATPAKDDFTLTFYRLLGCPYCAKVEWVLRYHAVPYHEVCVDTLNARGIPDKRYALVPQLYLAPADATRDGAFLVDSAYIVDRLAEPLGYQADLVNPRIRQTREWITSRFQSASFVLTNATPRYAYATYAYVTPSQYQAMPYRVLGSLALYALATWKIKPRLLAAGDVNSTAEGVHEGNSDKKANTRQVPSKVPEEWLRTELGDFLARRPDHAIFHGGARPDLADIEMYGVTRVVNSHPYLGHVVREGAFGAWQTAMERVMRERGGAQN